jgi:pyrroline-5-carboxylate reductase
MTTHSLLLVGCGKMGGALLSRWKQGAHAHMFHVVAPHHAEANAEGIAWHRDLSSLPADINPDIIVFAVKPQQLDALLPLYRARFDWHGGSAAPLYVSIAAGKNTQYYIGHLGEHTHIIRAMPNTPALIGHGMTVLYAPSTVPASARKAISDLMQAVGKTLWVEDESLMDAVSAISGCGPAYMFLFLESLVKAGVNAGLTEAVAQLLAVQTMSGSIALAEQSAYSLEQLRMQVASPGGMTQAALDVLMKGDHLQRLMDDAVQAAVKRAKALASA